MAKNQQKITSELWGWSRDFKLLALSSGLLSAGFAVYMTTFNNFIVEEIGIQPHQFGVLESIREIPGFLTVGLVAISIRFPAARLAGFLLILTGIGVAAYFGVHSVGSLILASLVWSVGFHGWLPQRETLALTLSDAHKGRRLGQLRSIDESGFLLAMALTFGFIGFVGFRWVFLAAGLAVILGGFAIFPVRVPAAVTSEDRFVFRREYFIYYLLTFFQGCRRQVFVIFAVFSMVFVHGATTEHIIVLMFVSTLLAVLAAPTVGRLIDRLGERKILSAAYSMLILIFWGYSFIQNKWVLYALYCVDRLLFLASVSLSTYLNRIARTADLRPTISLGVTLNHVAAVTLPLVGGFLWDRFGYALIFQIGSVVAVIILIIAQFIEPAETTPSTDSVEESFRTAPADDHHR